MVRWQSYKVKLLPDEEKEAWLELNLKSPKVDAEGDDRHPTSTNRRRGLPWCLNEFKANKSHPPPPTLLRRTLCFLSQEVGWAKNINRFKKAQIARWQILSWGGGPFMTMGSVLGWCWMSKWWHECHQECPPSAALCVPKLYLDRVEKVHLPGLGVKATQRGSSHREVIGKGWRSQSGSKPSGLAFGTGWMEEVSKGAKGWGGMNRNCQDLVQNLLLKSYPKKNSCSSSAIPHFSWAPQQLYPS